MTDALVAFLRARLDEDCEGASQWHDLECDFHRQSQGGILPAIATAMMLDDVPGAVCDCGGPARTLREVEAKRRILRAHAKWCEGRCEAKYPEGGFDAAHYWSVKALAAVYADHPDYLAEWRP
ncbi:DUF6221 family protein [Streptomyces anulatus]